MAQGRTICMLAVSEGGGSLNYSDVFLQRHFQIVSGGRGCESNANVCYGEASGRFWINLFAWNLSNEEYQTGNIFTDSLGDVQFFAPPRALGIQVSAKF